MTDVVQCFLQIPLTVFHAFQISEESQRLDPQVSIDPCRVVLLHVLLHEHDLGVSVLAYFEHTVWQILSDVKVKQLLAQIEPLTAVFYTFRILVNLEQEQNVMLVNFIVVLFNQVADLLFDFLHAVSCACLLRLGFKGITWHRECRHNTAFFLSRLVLDFSLNALLLVQVTFQESVIEVDLR